MKIVQAALLGACLLSAGCERLSDVAFGARVRAYLLENPEVLREAAMKLEESDHLEAQKAISQAARKHRAQLENDPRDAVINPNGKITVVEFFDYNCGYCKRIAPDVLKLAAENPDVRFVFKDFTLGSFGPASEYAASAAALAHRRGRFAEVHKAFMEKKPLDEAGVEEIMARIGVTPEQIKAEQRTAEHVRYLTDVRALADALGQRGTPAFVVGDVVISGADEEALAAAIAKAKKA